MQAKPKRPRTVDGWALVLLALVLLPSAALGGTIGGLITDACSDSVLATVAVAVLDGKTTVASGFTDKNGVYSISSLGIAANTWYTVAASRTGYDPEQQQVLTAKIGDTIVDFEMVPVGMSLPGTTTGDPSEVTSGSVKVSATINPGGARTDYFFQYGLTTSYGQTTAPKYLEAGTGDVVVGPAQIYSLNPATPYHYRIYAYNCLGGRFGGDRTFTTLPDAPGATTDPATAITTGGALLNGTLNPNGDKTSYHFEYGTSGYDQSTSPVDGGDGNTPSAVSRTISGLKYNTTYHFRLVAANTYGTTYGSDRSFTTAAIPPAAVTGTPSSITGTSAVFNGTVDANTAVTTWWFQHGTTTSYGKETTHYGPLSGADPTPVALQVSGLAYGTLYHYRLVAQNSGGTSYGGDQSLQTLSLPAVSTGSALTSSASTVQLKGIVDPNGSATTYYFQYGLTASYGQGTSYTSAGSGMTGIQVSAEVAGLTPGTLYHYRLTAFNGAGTVYGQDATFTTPVAPTVTTLAASALTGTTAQLNGAVNPAGYDTTWYFEYGETEAYGSRTKDFGPLGGVKETPVNAPVSGLQPGKRYYFRLVAQNEGGTRVAAGLTFDTLTLPFAETGPVAYLTESSAQVTGTVNPNGLATQYYFQYGLDTFYGNQSAPVAAGTGNTDLDVDVELTGLQVDTPYHYRLVAQSTGGTVYGKDRTFDSASPPDVTTGTANSVAGTTAVLNGTVNPRGLRTTAHFEYGPDGRLEWRTPSVLIGAGLTPQAVPATVGHLAPNTVYDFRLVAENSLGVAQGDPALAFTTEAEPTVRTGGAVNVTSTRATLTGGVNPNGVDTVFTIEFGPDTQYGFSTGALGSDAGAKEIPVSAEVEGLVPDTLYHFRVVAKVDGKPFYGADGSFLTSEESYRFARMWPTLQQPWYFFDPQDVAADPDGYLYVADMGNNAVHKLTVDGHFVARWGRPDGSAGSAPGEFHSPQGVAVDGRGFLFVADLFNQRIQVFDAAGDFVRAIGDETLFGFVYDVAVDDGGGVYVVGTDPGRVPFVWRFDCRIQKDGSWGCGDNPLVWGGAGADDGQFNDARSLAVDRRNGFVYVADAGNGRVQKFTTKGQHLASWDGGFLQFEPRAVTVDAYGDVYTAEGISPYAIRKFTGDGQALGTLVEGFGYGDGQLFRPEGLAVDRRGVLYVADKDNNRIQLFSLKGGKFLNKLASSGSAPGYFQDPLDIAVGAGDAIYVADGDNFRIQKFTAEGLFETAWGESGSGPGQFGGSFGPEGVAADRSGHVYALDGSRLQKFTADGTYLTEIQDLDLSNASAGTAIAADSAGNLYATAQTKDESETIRSYIQKFVLRPDGKYELDREWFTDPPDAACEPQALAVESAGGYVWVIGYTGPDLPFSQYMIQKYTLDGSLVTWWVEDIVDAGGYGGLDIAVDGGGFVYAVDKRGRRVRKYTPTGSHQVVEWVYEKGTYPHQFKNPHIDVTAGGDILAADQFNNRVQKFIKVTSVPNARAVIVAGGGPFAGNNLWDATRMCTHFAYRTLTYQGYGKTDIRYLIDDSQLDLDGNGLYDDVAGDATNANLQTALVDWAAGAENVIVYLADHGGQGTFRMSGTETLSAADLNAWLNALQAQVSGRVIVIYEACDAGSFLAALTPAANRIVVTSTSPGESAYFMTQGSVSFSSFFWTHVFNGEDLREAFVQARDAIGELAAFQHPLMDTDGDGVDDAAGDYAGAAGIHIGRGTDAYEEAPTIGSVSPPELIDGTSEALLWADGVSDPDGIARVWAIIRPPGYTQAASDNPVQELPSVDLQPEEEGRYEALWDGFLSEGTHQIAIYARDRLGNTSPPVITSVAVNQAITRKAIVVAASRRTEPHLDPLWPAIQHNAHMAYNALRYQGYLEDDIYLMSPISFVSGVDAAPTLGNLAFALTTWASSDTQDVVVYLAGHGQYGAFQINQGEALTPAALDAWLDALQGGLPGPVTVVLDFDRAGSFLSGLASPADRTRLLLAAAGGAENAGFAAGGEVSFSHPFWAQVRNGVNVRDAFGYARNTVLFGFANQHPLLDDSGNGVGNEAADGEFARYFTIGMGIRLSGNAPQIGALPADIFLTDGATAAELWVEDVTTTGTIETVYAVITPPSALPPGLPGDPGEDAGLRLDLADQGGGRYAAMHDGFVVYGLYTVNVFVRDTDGNLSTPRTTTVFQSQGPDAFEMDDTAAAAGVMTLNDAPQTHTLHHADDADWIRFHGLKGETYDITASNLGPDCDTTLFLADGFNKYSGINLLTWTCPSDGLYTVRVTHSGQVPFGPNTRYDLSVSNMEGGIPGRLVGQITDAAGNGVGGALVTSNLASASTLSYPNGYYIVVLPSGEHTVTATADGFEPAVHPGVVVTAENYTNQDIVLTPLPASQKGNVDGNAGVDLADAVIVLKALSGLDTYGLIRSDFATSEADVDQDGHVGPMELIYILQVLAHLR